MNQTILLTGGTGFLGSNILKHLVKTGSRVVLLKRSFSNLWRIEPLLKEIHCYDLDRVELKEVFQKHEIRTIIHCATNYGRRDVSPTEMVEANLILPLHLLQLAEAHQVHAFINTDTILDKRVNTYSLSKKQFLDWLKLYSNKMVCVNLALEHFYGPFDDRSKFVTRMIVDLLGSVEQIDLTQGRQKRDFIFIDDVVAAFDKVIAFAGQQEKGFYPLEVGTGQTIEIRKLVETIKDLTQNAKTALKFGSLEYRENEVMESKVDNSGLTRLGWQSNVSLLEGLKRTIEQEKDRK